jgi:hypothetical protein
MPDEVQMRPNAFLRPPRLNLREELNELRHDKFRRVAATSSCDGLEQGLFEPEPTAHMWTGTWLKASQRFGLVWFELGRRDMNASDVNAADGAFAKVQDKARFAVFIPLQFAYMDLFCSHAAKYRLERAPGFGANKATRINERIKLRLYCLSERICHFAG